MEKLKIFIYNEWVFIPVVTILIFVLIYKNTDQVIAYLNKKSLGKKDEIIKYLRLMGVETEEKKVVRLMLLMSFGLGILFFLLFWPRFMFGIVLGTIVTMLGFSFPLMLIKAIYDQRCNKFVDQMVDALTIMANGVKAGSNPQETMKRVVEIMGSPIRQEFSQVLYQMQVGDSFENALTNMGERIPRPDVQMFVTSINILKETGGNLAETFQTIVSTIRERQKVEKKIQALTAQGLMQGYIMSAIPFFLMGVFFLVDPKFIMPMFTTTLGLVLLLIMLGLILIGGFVIKKVVTIKV